MANIKKEENKIPKELFAPELLEELEQEALREKQELKESQELPGDGEVADDLRKKLEQMELSEDLIGQVHTQAQGMKSLQDEEKIKELLKLAEQKGVVYAVHVAKKLGDSYIIDRLHDLLVQQRLHKKSPK